LGTHIQNIGISKKCSALTPEEKRFFDETLKLFKNVFAANFNVRAAVVVQYIEHFISADRFGVSNRLLETIKYI
jgi:hypothetical protein